ncbi:MAG: histidinol-phosphate transaminase [Elusimicrobia bacterium]|nr:histidinol-phosphate transaminase [Elusimicrobiota bacterium]
MINGIRKAILELDTYTPGRPIDDLLREVPGLERKGVVKLASNENPLGPSPKAVAAVAKILSGIHRYPEPTAPLLRRRLADLNDVTAESIIVTSGVDEALRLIAEVLLEKTDVAVMSRFAFPRFRQHARLMGTGAVEVPMKAYRHDLQTMAHVAREAKAKAVFVANPNNPTGTFNTAAEMQRFFSTLLGKAKPNGLAGDEPWVILDEAYHEFARDAYPRDYAESLPRYFELYSKLIILRTFSKIAGLAGLRVGYAVANAQLTQFLHRARLIFNVNSLGQAAALAALDDAAHIAKTLKAVKDGRLFLAAQFKNLGLEVVGPSAANFLLVRNSGTAAHRIYENLLAEGLIVRPLDEPDLKEHWRVSIGTLEENKRLIQALKGIVKSRRPVSSKR